MKKRRQTENGKTLGSGEEHLGLTNDEAKSSNGDHRKSSYVVECTTFKLEGFKDHERSIPHEHCIMVAQAKEGRARPEKLLMQQQREKMILSNSECPC